MTLEELVSILGPEMQIRYTPVTSSTNPDVAVCCALNEVRCRDYRTSGVTGSALAFGPNRKQARKNLCTILPGKILVITVDDDNEIRRKVTIQLPLPLGLKLK